MIGRQKPRGHKSKINDSSISALMRTINLALLMKTRSLVNLAGLGTGLALLAACASTQVLSEWHAADGNDVRFGHLAVVALFKQDQTRRMFEDEFAGQISNIGPMVTRSYNILPNLNANTSGQMANIVKAIGADGVLVIRMLNCAQRAPTATNSAPVPRNLQGFLQYACKDNYDPPSLPPNTAITMETKLFDVKSGKLIYSLVTEANQPASLQRGITLLTRRVIDRLADALQKK